MCGEWRGKSKLIVVSTARAKEAELSCRDGLGALVLLGWRGKREIAALTA
jgi:hypothetical protein